MAIKDPNVFSRINTLNTNLQNANITDVQRDISSELFGVLDGAHSISVDSELYASINDVRNASDLATRITSITFPTRLNINGKNIINTEPLSRTDDAHTQNSINKITSSENDLTSLEANITNLEAQLRNNVENLSNVRNAQAAFPGTARTLPAITAAKNIQEELRREVDTITRILSNIINEMNAGNRIVRLNQLKTEFDAASKTRITDPALLTITNVTDRTEIATKLGNYLTLYTSTNTTIQELEKESNLRNHLDSLIKTKIHIPDGFLPFGDDETVTLAGADAAATDALIGTFNDRINQLNRFRAEIPNIRTRYSQNKDKLNRILQLQRLQDGLNTSHPGLLAIRQDELTAISEISYNNLLLGADIPGRVRGATYQPNLPNTAVTVGCAPTNVPLNFINGTLARPGRFDYTLCDSSGNPLRINGGNYEYQLGAQTIALGGITFTNNNIANQIMTMDNLQVTPLEGLTFPLRLDLNVRVRVHDDATGLDIDHHKPIRLEITSPTLTLGERQNAYDSLVPPMNNRIQAEYSDHYREDLENEAIWRILREGGNEAEVNEIYNNETRRNMLINRIRTRLAGHIPLLDLAHLQTQFRTDMTRLNRDVPVQYLLSEPDFQNYVRQSIPGNLRTFALDRIGCNANAYRNDILQELIDFQANIANNRVDNNDNLAALAQVPADNQGPRGLPGNFLQRLRGRRILASRNTKNNYTRFYEGRQAELNNLSLETEDGTINYSVRVEVLGLNKIVATVNIDGKEEPEIIEASSHDRLIRGILTRANTKDGEPLNRKLRCNIALSVLKAMVAMSPQRLSRDVQYLPLPQRTFHDERGVPVPCDRIEADIHGGNLRLRGGLVDPITHIRQNVTIFDEQQFKNLHDLNRLEQGVRVLSTQINAIMNATATEYHRATSSIGRDHINRYVMKYDTVQRLRGGPIKRLRGNMLHGETSNTFDFSTTVNEAGKTVNINLTKGVFTVSGEFKGKHYEYKSKNLGSILRKKINRNRVFSGVELAMIAAINENFIQRLRENHRVQNENFVISDSNEGKSGRTYIFDASGDLSYLEIEDRNLNPLGAGRSGRINPTQVPTYRIRCNERERREFMQNPLLAGRLQRIMRRRLSVF